MGTAPWEVAATTCTGARHRAAAAANQDSHATCVTDGAVALAVADGHGHPAHFRSQYGSALAAQAAVELLATAGSTSVDAAALAQELVSHTGPALIDRWRAQTLQHLAEHPFSVEETQLSGPGNSGVWSAYGTTVVAVVGTTNCVGLLQLGDGDAVVVHRDGRVERPLPIDDANRGVLTSSLAQAEPLASLRSAAVDVVEASVAMAWVATDGFGSARLDQETWWREVSADLATYLDSHGLSWVEERMPGWLEESAAVGGDDVTLGLLVRHT